MFEHWAAHANAAGAGDGEPLAAGLLRLSAPSEVWPHTSVEFVQVAALDRELNVEIGYRVAWDEEHTLGARLRGGRLMELNGSVLPP